MGASILVNIYMILKHEPLRYRLLCFFYTIIISVYSKANSDDTEFNVGEMLKKKKFMNINEWKNKFSGAYISCMLKLARLESVRVPLSGKRPTNMAQECTFIFKLPHALHLSGLSLEGTTRG